MSGRPGHHRRLGAAAVTARGTCGHEWKVSWHRAREVAATVRQRATCPTCGSSSAATFAFDGRRCESKGCGNVLSKHNPGPTCHACDEAKRRQALAAAAA